MPILGAGQQHAGEERAERHREPDAGHQLRDAEHEQQRERGEHLAQARARHDRAAWGASRKRPITTTSGDRAEHLERAEPAGARRRFARPALGEQRHQRDQRDGGDVLEQEDRERGAARPARRSRFRSAMVCMAIAVDERPSARARRPARPARASPAPSAPSPSGAAQAPHLQAHRRRTRCVASSTGGEGRARARSRTASAPRRSRRSAGSTPGPSTKPRPNGPITQPAAR